jgi:energy-coupling factor transporter ATP-binding protein EcfA2
VFVNRLRFRGVKPINRDIPDDGRELQDRARKRLLLQGGNGSGKSTVLESIRALWEFFGQWTDRGDGKLPPLVQFRHFLFDSVFAALEVRGLSVAVQSLWLGIAGADDWADLKRAHPDALFAGLVRFGKRPEHARIELPSGRDWKSLRENRLVGREPVPNIIHFPPDDRTVAGPPKGGAGLIDPAARNWSCLYNPLLDLASLLLTMEAQQPENYREALRLMNLAIGHRNKRITGFGEDGRLAVEGTTEDGTTYRHPVEALSSGERQMLLLIAYTAGFLREGGIVLLDDPDLHIHISMAAQLMESLEEIVRQRGGQLIVASHSAQVSERFTRDCERVELSR